MGYREQINEVNLKLEESKIRQRVNNKVRKFKIKSIIDKHKLEKKMADMKSDQELMRMENKKSKLEHELVTLMQNIEREKETKKTKEEEIKKRHEQEKKTLENKFQTEAKEDKENVTNLEEIVNQLSTNLRELD